MIIIAACMPTLRPFFSHTFHRQSPSEEGSNPNKPRTVFSLGFSSTSSAMRAKRSTKDSFARQEQDPMHEGKSSNDSGQAIWRTIDTTVAYDGYGNAIRHDAPRRSPVFDNPAYEIPIYENQTHAITTQDSRVHGYVVYGNAV